MQRRHSFVHLVLAGVVVLGLTPLLVCVDAQAQIAFVSDRDGNWEIYVMDINGNNQQRLTNNRHDDLNPSWSPDGKRIVFFSNRDGHVRNDRPDIPTYEIYVMDIDGGNQQRFTENPHGDQYPSWSPDGQRIIFSSRRDGHFRNDFGISYEIYVMDVDGGNQQRLTDHRGDSGTPSWSPDGERIVFASDRNGNFEIYVMDTNGSPPRNLTNNPHGDGSPAWFGPAFAVASGEKKKHDMGVAQTD